MSRKQKIVTNKEKFKCVTVQDLLTNDATRRCDFVVIKLLRIEDDKGYHERFAFLDGMLADVCTEIGYFAGKVAAASPESLTLSDTSAER